MRVFLVGLVAVACSSAPTPAPSPPQSEVKPHSPAKVGASTASRCHRDDSAIEVIDNFADAICQCDDKDCISSTTDRFLQDLQRAVKTLGVESEEELTSCLGNGAIERMSECVATIKAAPAEDDCDPADPLCGL